MLNHPKFSINLFYTIFTVFLKVSIFDSYLYYLNIFLFVELTIKKVIFDDWRVREHLES